MALRILGEALKVGTMTPVHDPYCQPRRIYILRVRIYELVLLVYLSCELCSPTFPYMIEYASDQSRILVADLL